MTGGYGIVGEVYAHDGPIRSLCIGPLGELVSGCQSDSPQVKRWTISAHSLEQTGSPTFHDHWITALTSSLQMGFVVTGCMDCKIRIFDSIGSPVMVIEGHQKGIISFSWTADGHLISGSWDGTAKIWDLARNGLLLHTLGPHENGVNVLGLSDGRIATTSTGEAVNGKPANYKLRLWDSKTGQQIGESICDHSGSIRSICGITGLLGFATTSNDGSVALRDGDGTLIGTMMHPPQEDGSAPFVLCSSPLAIASGMGIVSGAEDGSVMVCEGLESTQSILHPTCVWCVLGVPNTDGDFISGGHDGVLRYFSKNSLLTLTEASVSLQAAFSAQVDACQAKKRKGPSSEEISKQVKWEAQTSHPGKSDGQVMVFNKDGKMIAAQWSSDSATWIEIGEVTGNGDGGDVNGVQYDHVLPVEIDTPSEGVKCLNIGYNNMESAYDAAQRFIDENGLGQHYLRQIADWITDRAGKNTPTLGPTNSNSSTTSAAVQTYQYFPVKSYALYDDIPAGFQGKIIPKITEFNTTVGEHSLTESELEMVGQTVSVLIATSRYHSSSISSKQLNGVIKMAKCWSPDKAFPAFDLCRMIGLHQDGSRSLSAHPQFNSMLVRTVTVLMDRETPTNATVTALRFLANSFRYDELRNVVLTVVPFSTLLDIIEEHSIGDNKLIHSTVAALLLNTAIQLNSLASSKINDVAPLLARSCTLSLRILLREKGNIEVYNRSIFTLGSITLTAFTIPLSDPGSALIQHIKGSNLKPLLLEMQSFWGATLGNVGAGSLQELLNILSQ
jgi:phospholipase A-2-activating protein